MAVRKTKAAAPAEPKTKKPAPRRKHSVTHEMIQERAYHLALAGAGGSPDEHWFAAERELLGV